MKLAWFRADTPPLAGPLDDTGALIAQLRSVHEIEVFTAASAHDFVWEHFRAPYDLSVYELDNTPAHAFIWPYLLHYGGVLQLRTLILHDSRAAALLRVQRSRDYVAEFVFNHGPWPGRSPAVPPAYPGDWPMLRVPLLASRVAVVSHPPAAAALQQAHPGACVRFARTGVTANREVQADEGVLPVLQDVRGTSVTFGTIPGDRLDVVRRAMARACQAGASAELIVDAQTWRPRGPTADAPIAVSIDPRDEEHSLMLAIRRLSTDATLRAKLGNAAHDWWRTHATPGHAAEDWGRILTEAALLNPPARPADWPGHLTADGTERAREILDSCGVAVDFL